MHENQSGSHHCTGCHSLVRRRRAGIRRSTAPSAAWDWERTAVGQRTRDPTRVAGRNGPSGRHRYPETPETEK